MKLISVAKGIKNVLVIPLSATYKTYFMSQTTELIAVTPAQKKLLAMTGLLTLDLFTESLDKVFQVANFHCDIEHVDQTALYYQYQLLEVFKAIEQEYKRKMPAFLDIKMAVEQ